MERVIEIIFDQFLKEICGEGERRIKLQAFSACLEVILGVRRVFLLMFSFCFSCFLSAISFFSAGFLAVVQWRSDQPDFLDPRLIFSVSIWLLSTGFLALTVREKKWSGAFRLQERIQELNSESQGGGFSEDQLLRLINRVLDEKLRKDPPQDQAS